MTTSGGTSGKIDYSYEIYWPQNDRDQNLWHICWVILWERDGSSKDSLHANHNGGWIQVVNEKGNDDFISFVNSRYVYPNGDRTTSVSDTKTLSASTMKDEWGAEEYYLQICLHPLAGGNVQTYSNVDQVAF